MSSAGGKQLEPLIGLVSQIGDVIPEPFARELQHQLQTNGSSGLVQKLVGTLNSNRKPNPEYPRMRRVIVEMVISIVKSCPRYATIFRDKGMMEALSKVERTPYIQSGEVQGLLRQRRRRSGEWLTPRCSSGHGKRVVGSSCSSSFWRLAKSCVGSFGICM